MLRRTTLPGLTALTLACGAAIAATAVSATAVSADPAAEPERHLQRPTLRGPGDRGHANRAHDRSDACLLRPVIENRKAGNSIAQWFPAPSSSLESTGKSCAAGKKSVSGARFSYLRREVSAAYKSFPLIAAPQNGRNASATTSPPGTDRRQHG